MGIEGAVNDDAHGNDSFTITPVHRDTRRGDEHLVVPEFGGWVKGDPAAANLLKRSLPALRRFGAGIFGGCEALLNGSTLLITKWENVDK